MRNNASSSQHTTITTSSKTIGLSANLHHISTTMEFHMEFSSLKQLGLTGTAVP